MGRLLTAVVALTALSCGDDSTGPYFCAVPCFRLVSADYDIDCDRVRANAQAARDLLVEDGWVAPEQVCSRWSETTVRIRNNHELADGVTGVTDIYGNIQVSRPMWSLAHEMLHIRDGLLRSPGTLWHKGWKDDGHFATDERFYEERCDPSDRR